MGTGVGDESELAAISAGEAGADDTERNNSLGGDQIIALILGGKIAS